MRFVLPRVGDLKAMGQLARYHYGDGMIGNAMLGSS